MKKRILLYFGAFVLFVASFVAIILWHTHPKTLTATNDPALSAAISTALGKDDPRYHFTIDPSGFYRAGNPSHDFAFQSSAQGMQVVSGNTTSFTLSLPDASYDHPAVSTNTLTYDRGDFTEWYVNGPAGLEQGFTFQKNQTPGKPLEIPIALTGIKKGTLHSDQKGITLTTINGRTFEYQGLFVTDAHGAQLPTRFAYNSPTSASIIVDDTNATYPITIDPFIQEQKLIASDQSAFEDFGYSVSMTPDGSRAVISADSDASYKGSAYIFASSSGDPWHEEAKLTASGGAASDHFGNSVSIDSGGSRVVVGAIFANSGKGAAYVFLRTGTSWAQEAELTASDGVYSDFFGQSVSIDSDGSRVIVGAYAADTYRGSAYTFTRSDVTWVQEQKLTASDRVAQDKFGYSVSMNSNGSRVAIGAYNKNGLIGAVYVFASSSTDPWHQEAEVTTISNTYFGVSVSINPDGSHVAIGAIDGASTSNGAVYVFASSSTDPWHQEGKIAATDTGDSLGFSIAINSDGSRVIAGEPGISPGGVAYIFASSSGDPWHEEQKISASDTTSGSSFGYSVSITANGLRGIIGARYQDTFGAAYTFPFKLPETLSVVFAGNGTGTVSSDITGIDGCATNCSAIFGQDQVVTLTATPDAHSTFTGWSGIDCPSGVAIMHADVSCTATFTLKPTHALAITFAGAGTGTVTSSPSGVDCTTNCSALFFEDDVITIIATPNPNFGFVGWSGDADCTDGSVTMGSADISCTAMFEKQYLASDALGQVNGDGSPNYVVGNTDNTPNNQGFNGASAVALDMAHHRLFVSDVNNARILIFNLNNSNQLVDRTADHVIGQADFRAHADEATATHMDSPFGLAYDPTYNRLFVSDTFNNRILVYDTTSITDGEAAINVIGQSSFTSSSSDTTASTLREVYGLALDGTNQRLFVADATNNRVLVFDVDPTTTHGGSGLHGIDGEDAINVLGQGNFTSGGSDTTASTFLTPNNVAYDGTNKRLFVADSGNNRVMVFDVDPTIIHGGSGLHGIDGEDAVNVLGQANFTSGDFVSTTASSLQYPEGLAYDDAGKRLLVAEFYDNRVTIFDVAPDMLIANDPLTDGPLAINVLGQADFSDSSPATTQDGLSGPFGLSYDDGNGILYVGDQTNNRVMAFNVASDVLVANTPLTDGPLAINALGQLNGADPVYTTSHTDNAPNNQGFTSPNSIALDETHHRLFVSDASNNRVLVFNLDPSTNLLTDRTADFVLGQSSFYANDSGLGPASMSSPTGLAYDIDHNRLFVGDTSNNRVLVFNTISIANGDSAVNVLGQSDFVSGGADTTQNTLIGLAGLAYDSTNSRLFVADANNYRVMVFDVDSTHTHDGSGLNDMDGEDAINVLGQANFTSSSADTTQSTFAYPYGLAYDSTNSRLFVADANNYRVMVFDVDSTHTHDGSGLNDMDGEDAINVLGQANFTSSSADTTQSTFAYPYGLAYDSTNSRLFVADNSGSRAMVFDVTPDVLVANNSGTDGPDAVAVLGQASFTGSDSGVATQGGFTNPVGLAYDTGNNRLYVTDTQNNRIMAFDFVHITTGDSLPAGTVGSAYSQAINTTNSQGTVTLALAPGSGPLPDGLSLGSITGTPTTAGTYTFTVRATDNNGALGSFIDDQTYTLVIGAGSGGGGAHHDTPPTSTPTPVPIPSFEPIPLTPTPTPSGSPSPTPFPSVSVSPLPSFTPFPSSSPRPSDEPEASPIPTEIVLAPGTSPELPPGTTPGAGEGSQQSFAQDVGQVFSTVAEAVTSVAQTVATATTNVVAPIAAPAITAIVAIPVALSGVSAAVASGSPAEFAFSQLRYLLEIVGLKRKRRVWGVIYDSKTKKPIPYAKIDLRDQANRILETRFADKDGRYGFLTSAASLHQQALKVSLAPLSPNHTFPSTIVTKDPDFIVYNHIYTGGTITISKDLLVNYNIPLDSSSNLKVATLSRPLLDRAFTSVMNVGFWIGIVAAPLNAIIFPSIYSITVLGIFILANTFRVSADLYRPFGLVYDSTTHKPLAYALVTLNKPTGERIAFSVSDEQGRYFLLADPGSYNLTVYAPANVEPQRSQTIRLTSKKGWIREKVRV